MNHIVVENSLAPKGYKVTTCMSGIEALELLESRQFLPDLILLVPSAHAPWIPNIESLQ